MIRTGQVLLVSTSGWLGRLVQWATGSAYNHSVVAISNTHCVSAEPGGAVIRLISDYRTDRVAWSQFNLTRDQRDRISVWAFEHIGVEYDHAGFVAIGFTKLLGPFAPRWLLRYVGTRDRLICSYLCDLALQAGDIHMFRDHRPEGAVTPASFGKVFVARGWTETP
jgi:hypothetical protein